MNDANQNEIIDREHLKLLSMGYMISAIMSALFSLMGLMYMVMAVVMHGAFSSMAANAKKLDELPPAEIAWVFGAVGFLMFLGLIGIAALKLRAAWCLKRQRSYTLCMIAASITCLGIPYGTVLGVCTLVVLSRPSVKAMFEVQRQV